MKAKKPTIKKVLQANSDLSRHIERMDDKAKHDAMRIHLLEQHKTDLRQIALNLSLGLCRAAYDKYTSEEY